MRRGTSILLAAAIASVLATGLCASAIGKTPTATLTPGGRAIAPPSAPPAVKAMIEAANRIHHRPYRWGGGHRGWNWRGYDCSGSVSYVMHAAGLRWDSSFSDDGDRSGPGWSEQPRGTGGFRLRHPLGLLSAVPLS